MDIETDSCMVPAKARVRAQHASAAPARYRFWGHIQTGFAKARLAHESEDGHVCPALLGASRHQALPARTDRNHTNASFRLSSVNLLVQEGNLESVLAVSITYTGGFIIASAWYLEIRQRQAPHWPQTSAAAVKWLRSSALLSVDAVLSTILFAPSVPHVFARNGASISAVKKAAQVCVGCDIPGTLCWP